jgi:hypothetical protein
MDRESELINTLKIVNDRIQEYEMKIDLNRRMYKMEHNKEKKFNLDEDHVSYLATLTNYENSKYRLLNDLKNLKKVSVPNPANLDIRLQEIRNTEMRKLDPKSAEFDLDAYAAENNWGGNTKKQGFKQSFKQGLKQRFKQRKSRKLGKKHSKKHH